jgi:hypothetical protein
VGGWYGSQGGMALSPFVAGAVGRAGVWVGGNLAARGLVAAGLIAAGVTASPWIMLGVGLGMPFAGANLGGRIGGMLGFDAYHAPEFLEDWKRDIFGNDSAPETGDADDIGQDDSSGSDFDPQNEPDNFWGPMLADPAPPSFELEPAPAPEPEVRAAGGVCRPSVADAATSAIRAACGP